MNISIKRKFFLAVVAMLAAGSLIFAQVKVSLTIRSNVSGAQVYLNNNLAGSTSPNLSLQVFPGTYTIRVVKAGYSEFRTSIVAVQSPITIIANLKGGTPQTPPSTPQAPPTPSYPVPSPSLPSPTGRLFIDAGISGARVYINGAYAGTTPYQGVWQRGNYTVRISASGYADYTERVFVDGNTRLNISLSPLTVEYEIKLPDSFSNAWEKPANFNDLELYIDGNRLDRLQGRIRPGRHTFVLTYRNLRFEDDFEVDPGRPVTIELFLGIRVH
jgi:hypothetical protein